MPSLLSLSLLALAAAVVRPVLANAAAGVAGCDPSDFCAGAARDAALRGTYLCGDKRLGPVSVEAVDGVLADVLRAYAPFDHSCPGAFLGQFGKDQWFRYPGDDGFDQDDDGKPLKVRAVLAPGTLVDRFGAESGSFVSPCGTPYPERSLPPANLATNPSDPSHPFNYHVYKVAKDFPVLAGPIAPFFGQPGHGIQYKLDMNISLAIQQGYLEPHATHCGHQKPAGRVRVRRVF